MRARGGRKRATGSKRKRRRSGSELHFGYNYSSARIPQVGAAEPPSRLLIVIFSLFVGLLLLTGILMGQVDSSETVWTDVVANAIASGRAIAFLIGFVGVPLALVYYYSAGIDWPFEEACRILMIGGAIGVALCAAVMIVGRSEGWLDLGAARTWILPLALAAASVGGYIGQRSEAS